LSVVQGVSAQADTSSNSLPYCKRSAVSSDPDVYIATFTQSSAEELAA